MAALDPARAKAVGELRAILHSNLPEGCEEQIGDMPGYVVPLRLYPPGVSYAGRTPGPYTSFASLKNFIALHHFGLYVDRQLLEWFVAPHPKHVNTKLDMGKSCIRFKKPEHIPLQLIAELAAQRSVEEWIAAYERVVKR
ncbi:MAG: DUF1801 domain-containing protein [Pseudohongiellaceae bacterium]